MIRFIFSAVLFSFSFLQAQPDFTDTTTNRLEQIIGNHPKMYPSLLWQVSGNGLKKPSYLYGTMHVSRKMVFRLTDSFFKALYSADVVALESDANKWIDELAEEGFGRNNLRELISNWGYGSSGFYNRAFSVSFPKQSIFEYLLQSEEELADAMMYRKSDHSRNFSEEQFLDMFIHQAGMKLGKQVTGLEDYKVSRAMVNKSERGDSKKDKEDKKRKRIDFYGEEGVYQQIENAYRNGDLDMLDSLETLMAPGKNFLRWMLWERNKVMARSFDSIVRQGKVLFAGVGAAHVPGDSGVVEMLRRMGYTVRPVFGKTTRWAGNQKDKIDAMQYRQNMQAYTSHRGDFSATLPGTPLDYTVSGHVEYFYPDMANGAYYKVTRLPYYGALSDQSPDHVLNRIDSLLFENIPGKILSKKKIERNGHPGWDIQNRTSLGDYQRYMIIATPVNLWFIKMAGQGTFAAGRNADAFFSSIQILEKTETAWQRYSPPAGGYQIDWPTYVKRAKSKRDTSHQLLGHADLHASDRSGNYYFLREARLNDNNEFFEEDTFELSELMNSMAYTLKARNLQKQFGNAGPYPDVRANMFSQVARSPVYLRCVMMNDRFYMIGCKHQDSAAAIRFIGSFSPAEYRYHRPFSTQTDSVLMYRTTTVEIENFGREKEEDDEDESPYGYGYFSPEDDEEYSKPIDTLGISSQTAYKFVDYSSGESITIRREISGAFETATNTDTIRAWLNRGVKQRGIELKKFDTSRVSGWLKIHVETGDTATEKRNLAQIWSRGREHYYITTEYDARAGLTPFVDRFIRDFTPIDTARIFTIPENMRKDSLLRGIFHPDSLIRRNHRYALLNQKIEWKKQDVSAMMAACKKLNRYLSKGFEQATFNRLLSAMAETGSSEVIPYMKELFYASSDTVQQQIDILNLLSSMKSKEAASVFMQLMIDETPLSNSEWETSSVLGNYRDQDSLQYVRPIFPAAFDLLRYSEYKSTVLGIAAGLLDSGFLKPEDYRNQLSSLLLEFRDEWKRTRASSTGSSRSYYGYGQEQNKNDEEGYSRYVTETTGEGFYRISAYGLSRYEARRGYMGSSEDELSSLGKLLLPYYEQPDVKKRLDKTWQTGNRPQRFEWVLRFLHRGLALPDSVLRPFIARRDYRWSLLSGRLPAGADSLRRVLDSGRGIAESFLCNTAIGQEDSLVYLGSRKVNHEDRVGTVYFFKHSYKYGYYDEWYMDMVLVPENDTIIPGKKDPRYWIRNREYNQKLTEKEQMDEMTEYLHKFDHPRWAPHSQTTSRRRYNYMEF